MEEFTAVVTVSFAGNNIEAKNKEDYIQKLKNSFMDEFGLDIEDEEISEIKEIRI
tara:strand:- start:882 stop:1046 length:165 start_codon:yes stop_codon:yes gene_type:complete